MLEHIIVGLMAVICIACGIWGWTLDRQSPSERKENEKNEKGKNHSDVNRS